MWQQDLTWVESDKAGMEEEANWQIGLEGPTCSSSTPPLLLSFPHLSFMASFHHSWLSSSSLFTSSNPTPLKPFHLSLSLLPPNAQPSKSSSSNSSESPPPPLDPIKLAFDRAKAYKKSLHQNSPFTSEGNAFSDPDACDKDNTLGLSGPDDETKLSADISIEKEKPHNIKELDGVASDTASGLEKRNLKHFGDEGLKKSVPTKGKLSVSSIDFVGLGFSDKKKSRGLPAGLIPLESPFPEQDFPDVEIIVGDLTKFNDQAQQKSQVIPEDDSNLYKPKVSTWGVFPRPNNISKTFGGGRVIRPGQVLESAEEKASKEARTRELLAAYKTQIGLNIDAKLKAECEEALKEGDSLMNAGRLRDALPNYEKVMEKLVFKSELHGLAALQWSICQDSLSRGNEARLMYEKLRSHPNSQVKKKARQMLFGFQAMEMMRVKTGSSEQTGYNAHFEAFIDNKPNFTPQQADMEEGKLSQLLPSIFLITSPLFLILYLAVQHKI